MCRGASFSGRRESLALIEPSVWNQSALYNLLGENKYPGCTGFYPSVSTGAPHWLNPTGNQGALEFVYMFYMGQPLGYRAGRRVDLDWQVDLPSTLSYGRHSQVRNCEAGEAWESMQIREMHSFWMEFGVSRRKKELSIMKGLSCFSEAFKNLS